MVRFVTGVLVLLSLSSEWNAGAAGVTSTNQVAGTDLNQSLTDYRKLCFKTDGSAINPQSDLCAYYKQFLYSQSSNSADPCTNAAAEYQKAQSALSSACGQAGVPVNSASGDIACGYSMARCQCLNAKSSVGKVDCSGASDDADDDSQSSSRRSDVPSPDVTARQLKYCPALAAKDTSDQKKDLDKLEDRVREDQDKANDAQKDVQKAQSDAQQKIDDLNDKKTEAQTKYGEDQEKASKDMSDAQKQILEQLNTLQNQYLAMEEQVSAQGLATSQAVLANVQQKQQLDLNCHAQATATISKMQNDALALTQAGRLNVGTQRNLLQLTGMSDFTRWEKLARKYYNRCINSQETVTSKNMANDGLNQSRRAIAVQIQNLRAREALLQQQMKQLKDPTTQCAANPSYNPQTGVGTCPTNVTQECQSICQAAQTQNRLFQTFQIKNSQIDRQINSATTQGSQAMNVAQQQAKTAQQRVSEDNTRMNDLRDYLSAVRNNSMGGNDPKAYGNVHEKNGAFTAAAVNLVSCSPGQACTGVCVTAKKYLNLIGQSVDETPLPSLNSGYATPAASTGSSTPAPSGGTGGGAGGAAGEKQNP